MKHETVCASQFNGCTFCVDMHVREAALHGECALPLIPGRYRVSAQDAAGFTDQTTPHGDRASKPRDGRV